MSEDAGVVNFSDAVGKILDIPIVGKSNGIGKSLNFSDSIGKIGITTSLTCG